jgi:hypothetical protein
MTEAKVIRRKAEEKRRGEERRAEEEKEEKEGRLWRTVGCGQSLIIVGSLERCEGRMGMMRDERATRRASTGAEISVGRGSVEGTRAGSLRPQADAPAQHQHQHGNTATQQHSNTSTQLSLALSFSSLHSGTTPPGPTHTSKA